MTEERYECWFVDGRHGEGSTAQNAYQSAQVSEPGAECPFMTWVDGDLVRLAKSDIEWFCVKTAWDSGEVE